MLSSPFLVAEQNHGGTKSRERKIEGRKIPTIGNMKTSRMLLQSVLDKQLIQQC